MMKQLPLLPLLLLFSLLTGNSSACTNAVSKVISTEGTDVMLPCSPSIRANLQNKLFDWKKVGQGGARQHEVFMWDSADHYHDHSGQSEQFKGRVSHFQNELQHGNASIVIRETKVIDSGSYTCVFPRQPSEEFCIELVVGASPRPYVTILDHTEDGVLLQCEVHGAYPKPKVEWTDSSGNMVPAAEPQVSERGGSYDVILQTTVTKTDNYSCVASQEEIKSKPAHTYVSLSGEESERSSGSNSGWIAAGVLCAVLFVVLVVGGVVVVRVVSKDRTKLNQLNEKIEKLEDDQKKTSSQDTLPADSVADPPENKILLE